MNNDEFDKDPAVGCLGALFGTAALWYAIAIIAGALS